MRMNLFKDKEKKTEETTKTQIPEAPIPPPILKVEPEKVEEPDKVGVQVIEREINLSLLNEKLNYISTRLEELIAALSK